MVRPPQAVEKESVMNVVVEVSQLEACPPDIRTLHGLYLHTSGLTVRDVNVFKSRVAVSSVYAVANSGHVSCLGRGRSADAPRLDAAIQRSDDRAAGGIAVADTTVYDSEQEMVGMIAENTDDSEIVYIAAVVN